MTDLVSKEEFKKTFMANIERDGPEVAWSHYQSLVEMKELAAIVKETVQELSYRLPRGYIGLRQGAKRKENQP